MSARRGPPKTADVAEVAFGRLAEFGGWVDPAVSLPGVPERVLAALHADRRLEVWPRLGLVRAVVRADAADAQRVAA